MKAKRWSIFPGLAAMSLFASATSSTEALAASGGHGGGMNGMSGAHMGGGFSGSGAHFGGAYSGGHWGVPGSVGGAVHPGNTLTLGGAHIGGYSAYVSGHLNYMPGYHASPVYGAGPYGPYHNYALGYGAHFYGSYGHWGYAPYGINHHAFPFYNTHIGSGYWPGHYLYPYYGYPTYASTAYFSAPAPAGGVAGDAVSAARVSVTTQPPLYPELAAKEAPEAIPENASFEGTPDRERHRDIEKGVE